MSLKGVDFWIWKRWKGYIQGKSEGLVNKMADFINISGFFSG
jgi:hypothetical protein